MCICIYIYIFTSINIYIYIHIYKYTYAQRINRPAGVVSCEGATMLRTARRDTTKRREGTRKRSELGVQASRREPLTRGAIATLYYTTGAVADNCNAKI